MDDKTVQAYDRIAEGYERGTEDYWERTPKPPFIGTFTDRLVGTHVLDVGSGTGRDALIFRAHGLLPICLDASPAMVKRSVKRGLPSVLADFSALPFPDAAFDGVWAYTSLLHVPKASVGEALGEIRRVLKPEGLFGLGLLEGLCEEYRDVAQDGNPRWFSYYTIGEIVGLLATNGFTVLRASSITPRTMTLLHVLARPS
jgi:ubiquinone/menaquinone biosynthesis C-methylase UbiE